MKKKWAREKEWDQLSETEQSHTNNNNNKNSIFITNFRTTIADSSALMCIHYTVPYSTILRVWNTIVNFIIKPMWQCGQMRERERREKK